jgi:hypothetical protein
VAILPDINIDTGLTRPVLRDLAEGLPFVIVRANNRLLFDNDLLVRSHFTGKRRGHGSKKNTGGDERAHVFS